MILLRSLTISRNRLLTAWTENDHRQQTRNEKRDAQFRYNYDFLN